MGQRGKVLVGVCASLLGALVLAQGAQGATLTGDYQFQNGLNSTGGVGPALTGVGSGANTFHTEPVFGVPHPVLAFPVHNGLRMAPAGIPATTISYSVVMSLKLDEVSDFRRLIDFTDADGGDGLFVHDGVLDLVTATGVEGTGSLTPGSFATVALAADPLYHHSKVYVDGVLAIDDNGLGDQTSIYSDALRFFSDPYPPQESGGAVSCIRVFLGSLSPAEVGAIGASPTCGGPPLPAPATPAKKKCKRRKHGHKRSASSSKKKHKKCRKKKGKKRLF
jgi:hypothetical protein